MTATKNKHASPAVPAKPTDTEARIAADTGSLTAEAAAYALGIPLVWFYELTGTLDGRWCCASILNWKQEAMGKENWFHALDATSSEGATPVDW